MQFNIYQEIIIIIFIFIIIIIIYAIIKVHIVFIRMLNLDYIEHSFYGFICSIYGYMWFNNSKNLNP